MKSLKVFAAALAAFALLSISTAQAQDNKNGWQERVKSEKIGFITSELELTPEEAQAFWPVYNKIEDEKKELQKKVKEAYAALTKALKEDTANEKEINKLLDNYIAAKQAVQDAGRGNADKYRKVLSGKKVAKLYIAEEKFRRQNIRNLGGQKPQGGPQGGPQGRPHGGHHGARPAPQQ